jgi:hypothetical protein
LVDKKLFIEFENLRDGLGKPPPTVLCGNFAVGEFGCDFMQTKTLMA